MSQKHKMTPFGLTSKAISEVERKSESTRLRVVIGERFRRAREIEGLGQTEAAAKLGYANSTQLSLFEKGERTPPIELFVRAVEVYGVSLDYLVGMSDEPERDPRTAERLAVRRQVNGILNSTSEIIINQLSLYLSRHAPSLASSRNVANKCRELLEALEGFISRNNAAFQDMSGGARVERLMSEAQPMVIEALRTIERHERMQADVIASTEKRLGIAPMSLFPEEGQTRELIG